MSKSIKHMTYEIVNGKMVWRTIKTGETPRESVCVDCQIQRPKREKVKQVPEPIPEEEHKYGE